MSYFKKIQADFNPSNMSAFGDLVSMPLTPLFQFDFVHGILASAGSGTVSGTGAVVDTSLSRLRLQSGTTATTGSARFQSYAIARYRAGQGITARFTAVFGTPAAGNVQEFGAGTENDAYCFGYNGTSFGILHRTNGSGEVLDNWVAQSSWNGDKCDGSGASGFNWTPTNGNVCMIRYPYLGYGDIQFFVEDSTTGSWILCHTIRYTNSSSFVQLSNPSLRFWARCANNGANTTNVTCYAGSVGFFLHGERKFYGGQFSADNTKASITTETNILTIKNCTTLNGATNMGVIRLRSLSFGCAAASSAVYGRLRMNKGTTLGGTPSYTPTSGSTADGGNTITSGQSIASVDVAGTTLTGGTVIFNSMANANTGFQIDLSPYDIFILPGETITFSMVNSASAAAIVSVNWQEDI